MDNHREAIGQRDKTLLSTVHQVQRWENGSEEDLYEQQ